MYGRNFVICDPERQYAKNLLQIFAGKQETGMQLYLFYTFEELQKFALQKKIHILLIAEEYPKEQRDAIEAESKYVLLREQRELSEEECGVLRYQSADVIWTQLVKSAGASTVKTVVTSAKEKGVLIGVYSPVHRIGKTRFAIRMGKKLAEREPVLYLNLEAYAGTEMYFREKTEGHLGDLLYYQKQERGNIGIRLSTIAGQLEKLDYVSPLPYLQDLKSVKKEEWLKLLERILRECIYEKVIVDIGDCVDGMFEILRFCDVIYTPYIEETVSQAKMMQYTENLRKTGMEDILEKTVQRKVKIKTEIRTRKAGE